MTNCRYVTVTIWLRNAQPIRVVDADPDSAAHFQAELKRLRRGRIRVPHVAEWVLVQDVVTVTVSPQTGLSSDSGPARDLRVGGLQFSFNR